ncbi:hypothetical protein AaE_007920, partial [Aphanomyces astaci]
VPCFENQLSSISIDYFHAFVSVDGLTGGALASGIYMYMEHGDPFVRQFIQTILNQVATPVLTMIQQWTLEGFLQDPYVRSTHALSVCLTS